MLCFEAKRTAVAAGLATSPDQRAIQKVAAVKLHTGLCRGHFQHSPVLRVAKACGRLKVTGVASQNEVVVIAFRTQKLWVWIVDVRPDQLCRRKVEWGFGNGHQFAGRDQRVVDCRDVIGEQRKLMAEDGGRPLTSEVEIGVVGQIHDCRLVRASLVTQRDDVAFDGVTRKGVQPTRKALVSVFARQLEGDAVNKWRCRPVPEIKSNRSSVKRIDTIVGGYTVQVISKTELAPGNTVAKTTNRRAEECVPSSGIRFGAVIAERDVCKGAVAVFRQQRYDAGTKSAQGECEFRALDSKKLCFCSIRQRAEAPGIDLYWTHLQSSPAGPGSGRVHRADCIGSRKLSSEISAPARPLKKGNAF